VLFALYKAGETKTKESDDNHIEKALAK